jgi:hypothetical protein
MRDYALQHARLWFSGVQSSYRRFALEPGEVRANTLS